jgi:hypothetical protein
LSDPDASKSIVTRQLAISLCERGRKLEGESAMAKPVYEWIAAGEEWSEPWGGSAAQWFGNILHTCLPADAILEIDSGFGHWLELSQPGAGELARAPVDRLLFPDRAQGLEMETGIWSVP